MFRAHVLLLLPAAAWAQAPARLNQPVLFTAPAVAGSTVVFGSALTLEGTTLPATDLWVVGIDGHGLKKLTGFAPSLFPPRGVNAVAISPDAARAAYTAVVGPGAEEVHVVDLASGMDRRVALDTGGCIQPLCVDCFFPCIATPHLSADGGTVLYSARRQQPFYTVRADGTGLKQLPTFSGALAPAPQRVISRGGAVVFTSSAPAGPTFAPSATDVYLMDLNGGNLRPVTRFGNDASLVCSNATLSDDGGTIAFSSNRDPVSGKPGQAEHVYVVRADGGGLASLGPGTAPSISADGAQVAFLRDGQVQFVRADGTGLKALTNFKMSAAQDAAIGGDASRVVFGTGPDGLRSAIYAVNADGTGLRAVYAPRSLTVRGVQGGVAGAAPSPGSLFTVSGTNLQAVDGTVYAPGFPLPATLGDLSLLVNGNPAPLIAVTPWQITAQLPAELPDGAAAFQLRFSDGAQPTPTAANVKSFDPAIYFNAVGPACTGTYHAGGIAVDQQHAAEPGEILASYWTGLGVTNPFVPAGVAAPAAPPAQSGAPEIQVGGVPATVTFSGLTPGMAGLYQVNFVVPSGLAPGPQGLTWLVGGVRSGSCVTVWVR